MIKLVFEYDSRTYIKNFFVQSLYLKNHKNNQKIPKVRFSRDKIKLVRLSPIRFDLIRNLVSMSSDRTDSIEFGSVRFGTFRSIDKKISIISLYNE